MPSRLLVVATANPGKLREFRALLSGLAFDVKSLAELEIESPPETGRTFLENALLKARHAARAADRIGLRGEDTVGAGGSKRRVAALADDSGLEVDALHGAPGIYSARFAGPAADDGANNAKLVAALSGVPAAARGARYRCALAFVADADDPKPLTAEGVWEGMILEAPRGAGGFGYDPYFWIPALRASAAELEPERKNLLSHRGTALRALREQLERTGTDGGDDPTADSGHPPAGVGSPDRGDASIG